MSPRGTVHVLALMTSLGCGRIGFDASGEGTVDGQFADGDVSDLRFRVTFDNDSGDVAGGASRPAWAAR